MLILHTSLGIKYIQPQQVVRVQAFSNYCRLFFIDGSRLLVAKILQWFEQKLRAMFCRIDRSHLVNQQYIQQFSSTSDGLVLQNGETIKIARRKRRAVKKYLSDNNLINSKI